VTPGDGRHSEVDTDRLALLAFNQELLVAFMANDREGAESALNVRFPEPFEPPPENGDVLDFFFAMVRADESRGLFLPRLIVRKEDRMTVGSVGVNPPDASGSAMTGYSIYPVFEGNGYATEAASGIIEYALSTGLVRRIFATIPVGHIASERVISRAGLKLSDEQLEDGGLILNVWERFAS
jgi:[ribosomal protein S5]-alanine N-acetyltransferase